jgi:glyoxylase-like metal-dependent hydrolase (beta-lactamase superfamily II)
LTLAHPSWSARRLAKCRSPFERRGPAPENITDVFVTHIHPDHTGSLMNGNTKVFPSATIHINKREVDYWFNKSIAATAVEPQKTFFAQVEPKVKPYIDSGQLKTFEGATEFFPGFRSEPAYAPGDVQPRPAWRFEPIP